MPIEPFYLSTTPIYLFKDNQAKGLATGFFYIDDEANIFLVTNKHVIYGERYFENPSAEVNKFKLKLHTNTGDLSQNELYEISIFDDNDEKAWLEHSDSNVDIVVLPMDVDRNRYVIAPITKQLLEVSPNIVINFEKIFVMGYPHGWYDTVNNLPITRIGHLSSPFDINFQGQPIMLGDVETHPGMSGGPVFMLLKDYEMIEGNTRRKLLGASKLLLVGVHSGQPRWDLIDNATGEIRETVRHSLIISGVTN